MSGKLTLNEDIVPSRLLRNAGVKPHHQYVSEITLELEKGEIVIYFLPVELSINDLGRDVIDLLGASYD